MHSVHTQIAHHFLWRQVRAVQWKILKTNGSASMYGKWDYFYFVLYVCMCFFCICIWRRYSRALYSEIGFNITRAYRIPPLKLRHRFSSLWSSSMRFFSFLNLDYGILLDDNLRFIAWCVCLPVPDLVFFDDDLESVLSSKICVSLYDLFSWMRNWKDKIQ